MRTSGYLSSSLVLAGLLSAGAAWAQEPAPAEPAAPGAPEAPAAAEPAPAPAPAPAEAPPAPAEPAPAPVEAAPAPAPAEEAAEEFPAAWFRIDSDLLGLQLWAGATHSLGDGIGLASDIYVTTAADGSSFGEFDIGPAITAGPVTLTPMIGIGFNWSAMQAATLVPQFFAVGGVEPIYFELWAQMFLNSVFVEDASNILYTRLFVDFSLGKYIAIGPQAEITFGLNNDQDAIVSAPVGGNVMLTNYGEGNTLIGFLGYETKEAAQIGGNKLAGRLTFIHNF